MKKILTLIFFVLLGLPCVESKEFIETVPLFQGCGIYFHTDDLSGECVSKFREKGSDKWQKAFSLMKNPEKIVKPYEEDNRNYIDESMFRGSIINLKEDTEYELRITYGSKTYGSEFKTWNSNPPIKKTINVKDIKSSNEIVISEKGTKDGWIKYTAEKGYILKSEKKDFAIKIIGAEYVILENLAIEGGDLYGILLQDSSNIRIVNCDVSGFGRAGEQDFTKDGRYYRNGELIGNDSGICINKSGKILIERCYIHDPLGSANSWSYGHPTGMQAIKVLRSKGEIVLRYNDFIGSDQHRWNDAVSSGPNGSPRGGFYRDAEINGNMFIFANDDSIEIEGGEMNVRVFLNKLEASLCGISTAPCLLGPSYLYRNLIVNLGDEDNLSYEAFKNAFGGYDRGRVYLFNNTVYSDSCVYGDYNVSEKELEIYGKEIRGYTRNNIFFSCKDFFGHTIVKRANDFDYDFISGTNPETLKNTKHNLQEKTWEMHGIFGENPEFKNIRNGDFRLKEKSPASGSGVPIENFAEKNDGRNPDMGAFQMGMDLDLPYRPIPVYLDKYQLNFKFDIGKDIFPLTVNADVKGVEKYSENFEIRKNSVFDWFTVEPSKGIFKENSNIQFKISIDKKKILHPGLYKGLFLIRLDNGYSRPVTVYASAEAYVEHKNQGESFVLYIEAEKASSEQPFKIVEDPKASESKAIYVDALLKDKSVFYDFTVPKDGDYFIIVRVKSEMPLYLHDSIFISVDNGEPCPVYLRNDTYWRWSCFRSKSPAPPSLLFSLQKGSHRIRVSPRKSIYIDMFLLTDDCKLIPPLLRSVPPNNRLF